MTRIATIRASMLAVGLAVSCIAAGKFLSTDLKILSLDHRSNQADLKWNVSTFLAPLNRALQARSALASTSEALEASSPDNSRALTIAKENVGRALRLSPVQPDIWLASAQLLFRQANRSAAMDSLKMSYLTGQHDTSLVDPRLRLVVHSDAFTDPEVRDFARRDVRALLQNSGMNSRLKSIFGSASPSGQSFLEETVREMDQNALSLFR